MTTDYESGDFRMRSRRTKSVTRAEEIQKAELKVRRSQPDRPWVLYSVCDIQNSLLFEALLRGSSSSSDESMDIFLVMTTRRDVQDYNNDKYRMSLYDDDDNGLQGICQMANTRLHKIFSYFV